MYGLLECGILDTRLSFCYIVFFSSCSQMCLLCVMCDTFVICHRCYSVFVLCFWVHAARCLYCVSCMIRLSFAIAVILCFCCVFEFMKPYVSTVCHVWYDCHLPSLLYCVFEFMQPYVSTVCHVWYVSHLPTLLYCVFVVFLVHTTRCLYCV